MLKGKYEGFFYVCEVVLFQHKIVFKEAHKLVKIQVAGLHQKRHAGVDIEKL